MKEIRSIYAQTMERDGIGMEGGGGGSGHSARSGSQTSLFRSQTSLASNGSSAGSTTSAEKSHSEDYERFGFANTVHPWETFYDPPGALVLDCLHYYAKVHTDDFVRFVIENSSYGDRQHDCPLVVAAGELVRILLSLLGMGGSSKGDKEMKSISSSSSSQSESRPDLHHAFYPMLFDGEKPFEELFSIGLSLFNRTWHEIHATAADMSIVESFLAEKLRKTLASSTNVTSCFDSFKKEVMKISYAEINRRWNEERDRRDRQKEELPVIKELKTLLRPEMVDIVRQHRLNYLVRGTRFDKYTAKGKWKFRKFFTSTKNLFSFRPTSKGQVLVLPPLIQSQNPSLWRL